jgi:hypothetical protein
MTLDLYHLLIAFVVGYTIGGINCILIALQD